MKKVLHTATVVKTHINAFLTPSLKALKEAGCRTFVAAKNDYETESCEIPYCDSFINIDFVRSPFRPGNIRAYRKLKALMDEERFTLIHCHTPVAAVLTRIVGQRLFIRPTDFTFTGARRCATGCCFIRWRNCAPGSRMC